jgi:hypothetical protein
MSLTKLSLAGNNLTPLLSNSVSDPDWIQIQSGQWIRIRIRSRRAKMIHKKIEKEKRPREK